MIFFNQFMYILGSNQEYSGQASGGGRSEESGGYSGGGGSGGYRG